VGTIVIAVFMAVSTFLMLAGDLHWYSGFKIKVYFKHPGALREGAAVHAGGKVIGKVKTIRLVPKAHADKDPKHLLHGTGGVVAILRIEKRFRERVALNGQYYINSKGMLGKNYLEIGPPADGGEWTRVIEPGDEVRGADPPKLDMVMQRSYDNLMVSAKFLAEVKPEWTKLRTELTKLQKTLDELSPGPITTAQMFVSIKTAIADAESIQAKLKATNVDLDDVRNIRSRFSVMLNNAERSIDQVRGQIRVLMKEVDRLRARIPKGLQTKFKLALSKTDQSMAKLKRIMKTAQEIAAIVKRGEGNIGHLMNDPEFSDDAKKLGKLLKSQPWRLVSRPLMK